MHSYHYVTLFGSAVLAGMINSVAGGGTLVTFPALLWAGVPAIVANATSTVALWPGQLSSLFGYRKEIGQNRELIGRLALPSLAGGLVGGLLLLRTDAKTFEFLVPFLILTATLLFLVQEPVSRWLRSRANKTDDAPETAVLVPKNWVGVIAFQFGIAVYGGYFGAGIGILMLAALGILGLTNIHQMNGLKNINGLCINAVAATMFIANKLVDWRIALLMAAGAIFGGYAGAGTAKRIGQKNVRRIVIGIGFVLTAQTLWRAYGHYFQ